MTSNCLKAALGAAILIGLTAPSFAQAPPPQQPKAPDPAEVICKKEEVLGSRLAKRRVCLTRAEWAERQRIDRQELDKVQIQRGATYSGQ